MSVTRLSGGPILPRWYVEWRRREDAARNLQPKTPHNLVTRDAARRAIADEGHVRRLNAEYRDAIKCARSAIATGAQYKTCPRRSESDRQRAAR